MSNKEHIKGLPVGKYGDCSSCVYLIKDAQVSLEEVLREHGNCHGWVHCGVECCGPCDVCEGSGWEYIDEQ